MSENLMSRIQDILEQNGESFLDDLGVDQEVVRTTTDEIMAAINNLPITDKLEDTGKHLTRLYSVAARAGFETEAEQFRQFSLQIAGILMQTEMIFSLIGDQLEDKLEQATSETPWSDALTDLLQGDKDE